MDKRQEESIRGGMSRRKFLAGAGAAMGGVALAACTKGTTAAVRPSSSAKVPSTKPGQLVVRTWGDPWNTGLQKTVSDAFTKETGIAVKYDLTDFGPIQVKVQQALASGQRPPVDIVHTVGFFAELARVQHLVVPLDPGIVTNLADLLPIGRPSGGGTDYVNLYSYTFPVIYNKSKIQPPSNMSWSDLLQPQYGHSFFAASTFEVLLFPFAKILGVDYATQSLDPVWTELQKLRPNLSGFGQDPDFVTSMKSGQSKWGAFIVGNALALRDAGVPVAWLVPREGSSLDVDSMYVCGGLPDDVTYWAQKFINAVIDAKSLSAFTAIEGTVPTNKLSQPAASMQGDPAFPFTEEEIAKYAIPFSLQVAAEHQDQWQASYTAALQG